MKIALVHDWIGIMGGAERVLKELSAMWPEAPIYTLWANPRTIREHFADRDIRASYMQNIPGIRRIYPTLAPLMPAAIESFDFSGYTTVISSSVFFSKGIIVRPGTHHISYCYSPTRMLWDRSATYEQRGVGSRITRHALRTWDSAAAGRPDTMVAISNTVAGRISKYYRRNSLVIPPPVQVPKSLPDTTATAYFLVVSRLVPHKRLETVIDAFNKLRACHLIVAGDGPLRRSLQKRANTNVRFAGAVSDTELEVLYANCRAVIVPNEEDFGLTAVEAMGWGKPVLALRAGGATETVIEDITGAFYDDPIPEAIADGVRRLYQNIRKYDPYTIAKHAQTYSAEKFHQRMRALVHPVL